MRLLALLGMFATAACRDVPPDDKDPPLPVDTDRPVDTDTPDPVDTDRVDSDPVDSDTEPPAPVWPTRQGFSSGGGVVSGARLRARLVVGDAISVHRTEGARTRVTLGLGTTQQTP